MLSWFRFGGLVLLTIATVFAQPKQYARQQTEVDTARVPLTPSNVEDFIDWASRTDRAGRQKVEKEILRRRDATEMLPATFDLLFAYFDSTRHYDLGKSLVALGIIGQLKNPLAMQRLYSYIIEPLPEPKEVVHGALGQRDIVEMQQSKAVGCLAYLRTRKSDSLTLSIIQSHPSRAVRDAAINAYLFNHGDSLAAKERLRRFVRQEDFPSIDIVRRATSANRKEFDEGLKRFYALHPQSARPGSGNLTRNILVELFEKMAPWLLTLLLAIMILLGVFIYYIVKKFFRSSH